MARVLNVGRWGLDFNLANPKTLSWRDNDTLVIAGQIKELTSLEQALVARDQLRGLVKRPGHLGLVAVHTTLDLTTDGYYILESANINASDNLASLINEGLLPYSMTLTKLDTVMFESVLSGALLSNDHSKVSGEPFFAPPGEGVTTSIAPFGSGWGSISHRDLDRLDPLPHQRSRP